MNYAKIRRFDVTNGPNVRTTLFVSGCTHNCKDCFNKEQQDFNYGEIFTKETEDEFVKYSMNPSIKGINILGGEPLQQLKDRALTDLLIRLNKEVKKPIWLWTGYTYEEVLEDSKKKEFLNYIDVIIDGRFEIDKRDLNLKYRGSGNQRIIDVKKSTEKNQVIEIKV